MKNRLADNLILKVGSVLFAIILWLLVTNINDPSSPKRFTNVPVKIINTDLITEQGKVYEVLEDTAVIGSVTVWAPRSIIGSISQDNIVAVADMKDLTNLNTIGVKISLNQYSDKVDRIEQNLDSVKLNIEDREQISVPLKAVTSGKVEEGYMVGDVTPEQNLVMISGPKSVVSKINNAEVVVNITGFTNDIGTNVEIKLHDVEGMELSKERLTMNINSVGVKVEILASKQIPLQFKTSGTPAPGFRVSGVISSVPDAVALAGKSNSLKNLSVVEIPDTALDVSGLSANLVTTINLKDYLPNSMEFADTSFDGQVEVTVYIEPEAVRTITLSESDLSVTNVPEGYKAVLSSYDEEFMVSIRGLAKNLNELDVTAVKGTVDISNLIESGIIAELQEGYYDVPLSLNLPSGIDLKQKVTVRLTISKQ